MEIATKIRFFRSQAELRRWFAKNGGKSKELWIGFYKKGSGKSGATYADALTEALCFGWIDGIRKSIDAISYTNRFTPRRVGSNWSKINIAHAKRLIKAGKMTAAGLKEVQKAKDDGRWIAK